MNNGENGPAVPVVEALATDPHGTLAALQEQAPAHLVTGPDGLDYWLVTRYDDVRCGLADPRLSLDRRQAISGNYHGLALPAVLDANLLNMDPPNHTRLRRLMSGPFTAARVAGLRAGIEEIAHALIDRFAAVGHAELVADYAGPLPIAVICDILGVPATERRDFRAWTDALLAPPRPQDARDAMTNLLTFLTTLITDKRANPGPDLLTDLIAARDGSDRLTEDELISAAFLILFAGYENTAHLIGSAVLTLLDHPEQMDVLRRHPDRIAGALEELARYEPPAPLAIRRFATEDLDISGVRIPAGQTVMLSLAAANRDLRRFLAGDRLDLARDAGGHLALGYGIHYCLGAPLARLELEIALTALLARLPGIRLAGPREEVQWRRSARTRGLTALPVRFRSSS